VRGPDLPAVISNPTMVNDGGHVQAVGGYDQLNGFANCKAIDELIADEMIGFYYLKGYLTLVVWLTLS